MSHRRTELPQTAIGVAEIVLNIGIAVIAQPCQRKCLDGTVPVASDDRSLAGSEIRIERRPIRVLYHRSHRRADRPGFHRDCRLSYSALCAWWRRSQILSSGGGQKVKRQRCGRHTKHGGDEGRADHDSCPAIAGCRIRAPGSRCPSSYASIVHWRAKKALASRISTRSASASLVKSASRRK